VCLGDLRIGCARSRINFNAAGLSGGGDQLENLHEAGAGIRFFRFQLRQLGCASSGFAAQQCRSQLRPAKGEAGSISVCRNASTDLTMSPDSKASCAARLPGADRGFLGDIRAAFHANALCPR
jgi:hypothetical protein